MNAQATSSCLKAAACALKPQRDQIEAMEKIKTKKDLINQLMRWRNQIGLGFHPDTRGADYVRQDGTRLFARDEASEHDARIQQCFDACEQLGLDFYGLALDCFLPALKASRNATKSGRKDDFQPGLIPER